MQIFHYTAINDTKLEKINYLYVYATNPVLSTDVGTFFMINRA
ncbi:hypothetical protein PAECIP111894_05535 [Paenibacillus pseudetheri]|uniref:Uncharacterized protein n=1 Tax=Paenibacillus pseudetheri TaxID=2897682 RepID=A0ABN8FUM2_9BACL|nr:hypothetical protein PAECIP111894_05535 [Paenibacillus pseudetheri]